MDTNSIALLVTLALILLVAIWAIRTEIRMRVFFRGKNAKNLEDTLLAITKELNESIERETQIIKHLQKVDTRLARSIRGIETVRFNPFTDSGSNQSFATALLNDEGDGVIISSLYSRERVSVFAKPIIQGKSEYELSQEEREVLQKAR